MKPHKTGSKIGMGAWEPEREICIGFISYGLYDAKACHIYRVRVEQPNEIKDAFRNVFLWNAIDSRNYHGSRS